MEHRLTLLLLEIKLKAKNAGPQIMCLSFCASFVVTESCESDPTLGMGIV